MAWRFQLAVECAEDKEARKRLFGSKATLKGSPLHLMSAGRPVVIGMSVEGVNVWSRMLEKLKELGATTQSATIRQIWQVHKTVYEEIGHPEWDKAVYEAYFESRAIPY